MKGDNVMHDETSAGPPLRFAEILNKQGYPFQYAALGKAKELFERHKSTWYFEVSEFPVGGDTKTTHIDFILRRNNTPFLLCVECKRADPSVKDWCFATAPYVYRNCPYDKVTADHISKQEGEWRCMAVELQGLGRQPIYHIGLEVRAPKGTGNKPDDLGRPMAVNEAAGQVCKGTNGLIDFFLRNPCATGESKQAVVIPAVFTTARVWTTDARLDKADIETGVLDAGLCGLTRCDFVLYQYHLSTAIKHSGVGGSSYRDLPEVLASEFTRTVAVVSSTGIEPFLRSFVPDVNDITPIYRPYGGTFR